MNLFYPTRRASEQEAFTLIELLVVITIIAVLAGLLLPVGQKVLENSKKVSTKSTETQIISAVNSYQTDYGQYPVVLQAGTDPKDFTYGLTSDSTHGNHVLFNVLRAINASDNATSGLNSRRVTYFESKNVKNVKAARDGFIPSNAGTVTGNPKADASYKLTDGDLVDSWGNPYIIRIDSGYTNAVRTPYLNKTPGSDDSDTADEASKSDTTNIIRTGVISWTYGSDGVWASSGVTAAAPYTANGDDVDSWQ